MPSKCPKCQTATTTSDNSDENSATCPKCQGIFAVRSLPAVMPIADLGQTSSPLSDEAPSIKLDSSAPSNPPMHTPAPNSNPEIDLFAESEAISDD
ncbi:MAG: hypothetical protein EXS16_07285 [Gemmataceae bacterium]|nr:hypothetical protein [Gemmataceae bacterium]